jgi:DNA processing protein
LALGSLPGIGAATVRKLLDRFGSVQAIFAATPAALAGAPRLTPDLAQRLLSLSLEQLEAELLALAEEGIELYTWDDDRFPSALRALPQAPTLLFVRGWLEPADELAVAIVGTRTPSQRAAEVATILGRELASRGLTIVSGLALGVDTAGHQGALAGPSGRTIAVLGSGLRVIHPRENLELAERIAQRGALLSELRPNTPPRGPQLMARDRLVSGLSRAVIVVEAGERSGSLDTAARAQKQGRLVYAVPGSAGTEQLLAGGAGRLDPLCADFDALARDVAQHRLPDEAASTLQQSTLW